MTVTYDVWLVGLSLLMAVFTVYVAIQQTQSQSGKPCRAGWALARAGLALGLGVWCAHFIGIMALTLPIGSSYSFALGCFSLLFPLAGAGGAFLLAHLSRAGEYPLWQGASLLTISVAAMHYASLLAMRVTPLPTHDAAFLAAALLLAPGAAVTILWLCFKAPSAQASHKNIACCAALIVLAQGSALLSLDFAAAAQMVGAPLGMSQRALAVVIAFGGFMALAIALFLPLALGLFVSWRLVAFMVGGEIVVIALLEGLLPRFGFSGWLKSLADGILLTLFLLPLLWRLRREADLLADVRVRARTVLASISEGVIVVDRKGYVEYMNSKAEDLTGWQAEVARGAPLQEVYRASSGGQLQAGKPDAAQKLRRKILARIDGWRFTIEEAAATIYDEQGADAGMVMIFRDVSERIRQEKELLLAASVFSHATEGILITDKNNIIVRVNEAFCTITGFSAKEAIGANPRMLSSGRHHPDFFRNLWNQLKREDKWQGEIWNQRKNGETYPAWLSIRCIRDYRGKVVNYVAVFSDISERMKHQEHVFRLAYYDNLTGLANRALLIDHMERAISQAKRRNGAVGILFLDMDRFKLVNDTLGHALGDQLLQKVASTILDNVRDIDTVARFGGDEFVVCLSDMPPQQEDADEAAAAIAEKILRRLSEPFFLLGHEVVITPSIGVALYPWDGDTPNLLIKHADTAMYHAKSLGRDNVQMFTRDMLSIGDERLRLQSDLRKALENGEFVVYYQAQIDLASNQIIGAEALLRWNHPELGRVSPAKFIPVVEDTSLIQPIGDWVLSTVCHDWNYWKEHLLMVGELPRIAVNFSPRQFNQPDFVDKLLRVVKECGGVTTSLEVEITEATLMHNTDVALNALKRLRASGLKIAVDDFGVGYSSLSYLKQFPLDVLKIDQSFIRDLPDNDSDAQIARAIIAMGRSLNLTVLAEGVENERQLAFLRREGCQEVQGYLFSKPIPAHEFAELLRRGANL
jgi:diguanylate cyclase (GGDEF)-like protein/PAS domain S-box-containing protein